MNIKPNSGMSQPLYMNGETLANPIKTNTPYQQDDPTLKTNSVVTASYRLTISNEGFDRSMAQFESTQNNKKNTFERQLAQEETSKMNELDAEKSQFEWSQTTEKRNFENQQRIEKMRYIQQQNL